MLTVAKSLLAQMLAATDVLLVYLYGKWEERKEATLQSSALARELLETCLKAVKRRYIVIDGLDEFDNRDARAEICKWFQEYVNDLPATEQGAVRCLFVSQEDTIARKDLGELESIEITWKENKEDIKKFCKHWQELIWEKHRIRDSITSAETPDKAEKLYDITRRVSDRAKGDHLRAQTGTPTKHRQGCFCLLDWCARTFLNKRLSRTSRPSWIQTSFRKALMKRQRRSNLALSF